MWKEQGENTREQHTQQEAAHATPGALRQEEEARPPPSLAEKIIFGPVPPIELPKARTLRSKLPS